MDPPGEAELRDLSERFAEAETRIRSLVASAPAGNRRELLTEAVGLLSSLRREDFRGPITTAYSVARESGSRPRSRAAGTEKANRQRIGDLARSLHLKLDRGIRTTEANVRKVIPKVTADDLEEMTMLAVTAHVDRSGSAWTLGGWAAMNCQTLGRQASSRGTIDGVGHGGKVVVDVGECDLCASLFEGELIVGQDPLPPGHPNCSCVASAV